MKYIIEFGISWIEYLVVVVAPATIVDAILDGHRLLKFDSLIARSSGINISILIALSLAVYSLPIVVILNGTFRLMQHLDARSTQMKAVGGLISAILVPLLVLVTTFGATNVLTIPVSCILGALFGSMVLPRKYGQLTQQGALTSRST